jgi:hypothetical protein
MVRPMFRDRSSIPYFVKRIPRDVLHKAVGLTIAIPCGERVVTVHIREGTQAIKFSLGTRDASEAKLLIAEADRHLDEVWRMLRENMDNAEWTAEDMAAQERMFAEEQGLTKHPRMTVGQRLALARAIMVRERAAVVFPETSATSVPKTVAAGHTAAAVAVSLMGIFDAWRNEAEKLGRSASTIKGYGVVVRAFVKFLGHDDAARVTPDDVLRYKDHRLAGGASAKTIKDSDLAALKAVFAFAVRNRRLSNNPASEISMPRSRRVQERPKDFRDDEATAILAHALTHKRSRKEHPKTAAAKRWVPWLCAYTGARVGEIVQLRKQDVRQDKKSGRDRHDHPGSWHRKKRQAPRRALARSPHCAGF